LSKEEGVCAAVCDLRAAPCMTLPEKREMRRWLKHRQA
jgi:hypothetical protein